MLSTNDLTSLLGWNGSKTAESYCELTTSFSKAKKMCEGEKQIIT